MAQTELILRALDLRALDPLTERHLFEEAYGWRKAKSSPLRVDRAPIETVMASRADQVMMGLFNGRLEAVYWITQTQPHCFDTHFTSRRDCPREWALAGAQTILASLLDSGAIEVIAYVRQANKPLRHFVEEIGFRKDCLIRLKQRDCQNDTNGCSISVVFVKYAARKLGCSHRVIGQKTDQPRHE